MIKQNVMAKDKDTVIARFVRAIHKPEGWITRTPCKMGRMMMNALFCVMTVKYQTCHSVGIWPQAKLARTESTKRVCIANPHSRIPAVGMNLRFIAGMTMALFFLLAIPAYAQQCDDALTAGLVGHWKLDETSGTFADSSGQGNDGTQFGSVSYGSAGVLGKAINFDGVDDGITVSNPIITQAESQNGFAMTAWIKVNSATTTGRIVVREWDNFNLNFDTGSGGHFQCIIRDGSSDFYYAYSTGGLAQDVWHHVACTYDPNTNEQIIYLNGVETGVTDATAFNSFAHSGTNFGIANRPGGGQPFNGGIDDVRVYNRSLTAAEVKSLYNLNAGMMRYNTESSAVEYCDGDDWVMAGIGSYSPTAVKLTDGATDYLARGGNLTNVSDGKAVSGSLWFRTDAPLPGAGNVQEIYTTTKVADNADGFSVGIDSFGIVGLRGHNAAGSMIVALGGTSITPNDGQWHHLLYSFDLTDVNKRHLYINGVSDLNVYAWDNAQGDINFVDLDHYIGRGKNTGANSQYNGDLADFWLDFGTYIDFSSAAQRAKFRSPTGAPMYLGADGSLPTGEAPDIFLSGDVGSWHINKGMGGGFTENGTLTYSSSSIWQMLNNCSAMGDAYAFSSSGTCYYIENTGDTWANAQAACQGNGGYLVNINSADENAIVYGFTSAETFIGGQDFDDDGRWRWVDGAGNPGQQFWQGETGGSAMPGAYQNWKSSQPNSTGQDCLSMDGTGGNGDEWLDTGCSSLFPYVCEIEPLCASPSGRAGDIIYNQDNLVMQYCNGKDWVAMGPVGGTGGGGCVNPAGSAGDIMYNHDYNTMQFCNSEDWVGIGKQIPPTDGLIAHWGLDDSSGPAVDSISGNNGTWTNTPVYRPDGLIRGALEFDKINNNYVSVVNTGNMFTTVPFTISGWIKFNQLSSISGDDDIFFRMVHSTSPWNAYEARVDSGSTPTDKILFIVRDSGGTAYNLFSDNAITTGEWYHVALTIDAAYNATLFVNGNAQADVEAPGSLYSADSDFRFGGNNGSSTNLNGMMDEVRLYNKALTAQEIRQLYYSTK